MKSQTFLDRLRQVSRQAVFVTDRDNRITRVNGAFPLVAGYGEAEVVGESPSKLRAEGLDAATSSRIWRELFRNWAWRGELWHRRANGEVYLADLQVCAVVDADGAPTSFVYTLKDITFQRAAEESQLYQATRDLLTGLPNRQLFFDRLEHETARSRRNRLHMAVLVVGIERLNLIVEAFGRDAANRVVKESAVRLGEALRNSDTIGRIGADQFAVLAPLAQADDSAMIVEKVVRCLAEPFELGDGTVPVNAAVGVAQFPTDAMEGAQLIDCAESAMRSARDDSTVAYQFFDRQRTARSRRKLDQEARLRRALKSDELRLYYQPKVEAHSGVVVGAEALVRWQDPERGMIPPGDFIPLAEEVGLIEQLGSWVLREACRQMAEWRGGRIPPVRIAVNVSAEQFRAPGFVQEVKDVIAEFGITPSQLELEMTESLMVKDLGQVIDKLGTLRDFGVKLAIDDFGTGYSSLSYLSRFPVDTLKVDRAFVKDVETDPFDAEIARTVIRLGRSLKLEVVAEGAETDAQVAFLRAHDCDIIQGFYFSKPLTAPDFAKMLKNKVKPRAG